MRVLKFRLQSQLLPQPLNAESKYCDRSEGKAPYIQYILHLKIPGFEIILVNIMERANSTKKSDATTLRQFTVQISLYHHPITFKHEGGVPQ